MAGGYYKADWLVWSFEHNAWWGPNHGGYYTELRAAGLYSEAEAKKIEADANRGNQRNEEARHISTQAEHIRYALERYQMLAAVLNGFSGGNQGAMEPAKAPSASAAQTTSSQIDPDPHPGDVTAEEERVPGVILGERACGWARAPRRAPEPQPFRQ